MKVNVVSRKLIKPCTPTPPNLKTHKLSYLDEGVPPINVGVVLIYPTFNPKQRSHLKKSLAEILPKFYPLAGRYVKNDHYIDCNDKGAELVEAEVVKDELADLVAKIGADELNNLLPRRLHQVDLESPTDPLLSIQITEFKNCDGLVIGVSIWHKIFDTFSVGTFISAWSRNSGAPSMEIHPTFDSPELFPRNPGYSPELKSFFAAIANHRPSNTVVKWFTFNKEAIITLRSRLSSLNYSRVRVVSAVVARALIGIDRTKHGRSRATIVGQAVNMRGRMVPSPPEHSCGNLATMAFTRCISATEAENIGIQELVDLLGDSLERTVADCARMRSPGMDKYGILTGPAMNLMKEFASRGGDVNLILLSDWSKFGFSEADFGEGKPIAIGPMSTENSTVLMNNKEGDGIEAWLNLDRHDMAYFEQDEEIKKLRTP